MAETGSEPSVQRELMNEQIMAVTKLVAQIMSNISVKDIGASNVGDSGATISGCCGTFGTATDTFGTFGCYAVPPATK